MCLTEKTEKKLECPYCGRKNQSDKMELCSICGWYYCEECTSWEYEGVFCYKCDVIGYWAHDHRMIFCDECYNQYDKYDEDLSECKKCSDKYCTNCKDGHECESFNKIHRKRDINEQLIEACRYYDLQNVKGLVEGLTSLKFGYCVYISIKEEKPDIAEFFLENGTWLDRSSVGSILEELNSFNISYGKKVLDLFIKYGIDFESELYKLENEGFSNNELVIENVLGNYALNKLKKKKLWENNKLKEEL